MDRTGHAPGRAVGEGGGLRIEVELERAGALLPGRLAKGAVRLTAEQATQVRGVVATLIGTESWQHETAEFHDGKYTTRIVTSTADLPKLPLRLSGPRQLADGETVELPLEVPVPALGPATVRSTVLSLAWRLDVKADRRMASDVHAELDCRIVQPTALLRAGVVRVGQFALWEAADAKGGGVTGEIELKPMPICPGLPVRGRLVASTAEPIEVQEVRLELRAEAKATVGGGQSQTLTLWSIPLQRGGVVSGTATWTFEAPVPAFDLPTIKLPHGTVESEVHLILARSMRRDPHLVRDVAVCTTTEI